MEENAILLRSENIYFKFVAPHYRLRPLSEWNVNNKGKNATSSEEYFY